MQPNTSKPLRIRLLYKGLTFLFCLVSVTGFAQNWNKKQCAVVLTYDDALQVHLDKVVPALDAHKLKGTFYLTAASAAFSKRLDAWRKVAASGHELGNHTLFHPCNGNPNGKSFVIPEYDLTTYTLRRMTDEIKLTNTVLQALDGKQERTFAYPCGTTRIGDTLYIESLKNELAAARGVHPELVQQQQADVYNIGSYVVNGQSGNELIALVKQAMATNSLIVFLFHGVGGGHSLNVSLEAHNQLLHFLKENKKQIWTTTFAEATRHLKAHP